MVSRTRRVKRGRMFEILRTNDIVLLSFAEATLRGAGFDPFISDTNMSVLDGSIAAIPRRLLVPDTQGDAAKAALDAALAEAESNAKRDEATLDDAAT